MKLIMQSSPVSRHFLRDPNIHFSTVFSNTLHILCLCSLLESCLLVKQHWTNCWCLVLSNNLVIGRNRDGTCWAMLNVAELRGTTLKGGKLFSPMNMRLNRLMPNTSESYRRVCLLFVGKWETWKTAVLLRWRYFILYCHILTFLLKYTI
jgi:hypothetical protein